MTEIKCDLTDLNDLLRSDIIVICVDHRIDKKVIQHTLIDFWKNGELPIVFDLKGSLRELEQYKEIVSWSL